MIDFSTLFSQLTSSYWWLLPLFVLAALFKSPWFKGFIGEVMVNMGARLFLDKNDYHLIKNVTILLGEGAVSTNNSISPEDMNIPGWKLHLLKGARENHWSVWVNGNWRLTFAFEGEDAVLVDYHGYH